MPDIPSAPIHLESAALETPPQAPIATSAPSSGHEEITLSFTAGDAVIESHSVPAAAQDPAPAVSVKIQPARARTKPPAPALARWNADQLAKTSDPLAQGLAQLLELGVQRALFLATGPASVGGSAPVFLASAALAPDSEVELWSGLKWDPAVVPETWNHFVKTGVAELAPPATQTNVKSNRNVLRAAFGVNKDEWLILIRAGSAQKCRGVLAVIAPRSILNEIARATQLIASAHASAQAA